MGQNPSDGGKKDESGIRSLGVASAAIVVHAVFLMSVPIRSPNGIMNMKRTFIKVLWRFINFIL